VSGLIIYNVDIEAALKILQRKGYSKLSEEPK